MRSAIKCPYYYWTEALPSNVCDLIVEEGLKLPSENATVNTSRNIEEDIRKGLVSFFPENTWIEKLVIDYVSKANLENWNFAISGKEQLQFANYRDEAFYDWHRDCNVESEIYRKLSVTVQLSNPNDYEGGEFVMFDDYEIKFKSGDLIIFPSIFLYPHLVKPVKKGTRYSFVSWVW